MQIGRAPTLVAGRILGKHTITCAASEKHQRRSQLVAIPHVPRRGAIDHRGLCRTIAQLDSIGRNALLRVAAYTTVVVAPLTSTIVGTGRLAILERLAIVSIVLQQKRLPKSHWKKPLTNEEQDIVPSGTHSQPFSVTIQRPPAQKLLHCQAAKQLKNNTFFWLTIRLTSCWY